MLTDLGSTRRVITYCVVTVTSGWSLCCAIGFVGLIRSSAYWREMKDAAVKSRVKVAAVPAEQTRDNLA